MKMKSQMIASQHEKNEWARMAQDAYAKGLNTYGHRFSALAAMPQGAAMHIQEFDVVMSLYRSWLIDGWSTILAPVAICLS